MRKISGKASCLMLLSMLLLTACKPNPKEILSRKWKPIDVTGENITPNIKANIIKEGNLMEFTTSGKFISHAEGEGTESGTYTLSDDGKVISITSDGRTEVEMKIRELKPNRAVIESNGIVLTFEPAK